VVRILQCHEERIVIKPWTSALTKTLEGDVIRIGSIGKKAADARRKADILNSITWPKATKSSGNGGA
jgi:hypothetical protein